MAKYKVEVTQMVTVEIDEEKFTPAFLSEFRDVFYPFRTVLEHVEHLAQLNARGLAFNQSFIEGYGEAKDFGIHFSTETVDIEILEGPQTEEASN